MPKKVISDAVALIAKGIIDSGGMTCHALAKELDIEPSSLWHAVHARKTKIVLDGIIASAIGQACRDHRIGSIRAAAVALRAAADRLDAEATTLDKP